MSFDVWWRECRATGRWLTWRQAASSFSLILVGFVLDSRIALQVCVVGWGVAVF